MVKKIRNHVMKNPRKSLGSAGGNFTTSSKSSKRQINVHYSIKRRLNILKIKKFFISISQVYHIRTFSSLFLVGSQRPWKPIQI